MTETPGGFMDDSLPTPDHEEVERRAYFMWEARGRPIGSPDIDWLLAEQEFLAGLEQSEFKRS
jgi:hypothetical protein